MKNTFRFCALFLVIALTSVLLFACSAGGKNGTYRDELNNSKVSADGWDGTTEKKTEELSSERKIIKTYRVSTETKQFDDAMTALEKMIADNGGYTESSTVENRSLSNDSENYCRTARFTVRVPAEKAEAFLASVGDALHVTTSTSEAEDVSDTYYDIEAMLEELIAERDSLLKILDSVDTKADYDFWLKATERLSDVRGQIAVYQRRLMNYDDKVTYSTVHVTVEEVLTYTENSGSHFGSRFVESFRNGWVDFGNGFLEFLIWFVGALPVLLFLGVIAAAIVFTVVFTKHRKNRGSKNNENKNKN